MFRRLFLPRHKICFSDDKEDYTEERYTWLAVCDKTERGYEEVVNGRA